MCFFVQWTAWREEQLPGGSPSPGLSALSIRGFIICPIKAQRKIPVAQLLCRFIFDWLNDLVTLLSVATKMSKLQVFNCWRISASINRNNMIDASTHWIRILKLLVYRLSSPSVIRSGRINEGSQKMWKWVIWVRNLMFSSCALSGIS